MDRSAARDFFRDIIAMAAMAMGGKVAEELTFGADNVTSGAASDIQQVTRIARAMVTQFGFSDELGHVDYANEQQSYLGTYNTPSSASQDTQKRIDFEVKAIVEAIAEKFPGVMLQRPSLLLNPWAIRDTQTGRQEAQSGEVFRLRGLGLPHLGSSHKGDLLVRIYKDDMQAALQSICGHTLDDPHLTKLVEGLTRRAS